MLHDFISSNREELLSRTRAKVPARPPPSAPTGEGHGVPLFLTQLSEALRLEAAATPFSPTAIGANAATHGRELLAEGCTISKVVHEYADVGEAVIALAVERDEPVTPGEFHTLSRCVDAAIAEAVTEYGRVREELRSGRDLQHRGQIAHDLRNVVQTALLSFKVVQGSAAAASGGADKVLGRSLVNIRALVDRIVSDV